MNRRTSAEAWAHLRATALDGIACVQEAIVPPEAVHDKYGTYDKKREAGAAVVSFGPRIEAVTSINHVNLTTAPGRSQVVKLHDVERPLHIASIHAATGPIPGLAKSAIAAYVLKYWLESSLSPLLQLGKKGADVVLAGDFNTSTQWSTPSAHSSVQSILAASGFINCVYETRHTRPQEEHCPCRASRCAHVATFRRMLRGEMTWWSVDYVFVSESLRGRLKTCQVLNDATHWSRGLSDHSPIRIDLN